MTSRDRGCTLILGTLRIVTLDLFLLAQVAFCRGGCSSGLRYTLGQLHVLLFNEEGYR